VTFGELFAGIGGFSLGLERAGMTCKWQVEIDPYARAVLNKHWPDVRRHDDVRTFPPTHTHTHTQDFSVDLICGGFPCQDISVAGKGAGLAGARSGLWHEFARIIGELRPRYVIVENVAALLTRGMGTVLGDLSSLGYDAEWHVIPASAVGAPHRRERVWIVGVRGWLGSQADASRSDSYGIRSHQPEVNVIRDAELRDKQDCLARSVCDHVSNANDEGQPDVPVDDESRRGVPEFAVSYVADAQNDGRAGGARLRSDRERALSAEQGIVGREACGRGKSCRRSADATDAHRSGRQQQRRPESVRAQQPAAQCGGWWESEPDVGRVAHGVPSRVDRLRCLGNAVVPQVVEVIGRAILEAEARMTS
jgi:DNA (cytosine-5)-methyltransferase 1